MSCFDLVDKLNFSQARVDRLNRGIGVDLVDKLNGSQARVDWLNELVDDECLGLVDKLSEIGASYG